MLLIKATDIKKSYGEKEILNFKEFSIYRGDKIGLVGLNGAGKTTLLQILARELMPEEGKIEKNCEISYFKQFDNDKVEADRRLLKEMRVAELKPIEQEKVSGGEQTRIRLADAFSKNRHILFVDEPTSNLDIKGIELLKKKLSKIDTMVIISHDCDLINSLCTRIVEVREQQLFFYNGNYWDYNRQRKADFTREMVEYENYNKEKKRLEKMYLSKIEMAKEVGKRPKNLSPEECRLRNFLSSRPFDVKQKNIQSSAKAVLSRIEHLEVKEKPKEVPNIRPDFRLTNPPENKVVIEGENLDFSYGDKVIFDKAQFVIANRQRVAIIGDNGVGKTTLLNLIQQEYDGIRKVPKATLGYFHQGFENLDFHKTVLENVMEDSIQTESVARTILARLLLTSGDMEKKVSVLSGGERIKLAFAKLFVSNANILMVDEPTNYLDMPSVEALQQMFSQYEGTLVFVSHDRIFINEIATDLLIVKNGKIHGFHGNYKAYEESLKKEKSKDNKDILIVAAEMKRTVILAEFSNPRADKEALEEEYENVMNELKLLRGNFIE